MLELSFALFVITYAVLLFTKPLEAIMYIIYMYAVIKVYKPFKS